jgi:hypothetical protein
MKGVAFIVPTYIPSFKYTYEFIESCDKFKSNAHVYLIFSDYVEMEEFKKGCSSNYSNVYYKVYPHVIYHCPTYYKKWWMIKQLLDEYEYFINLDSEIQFIKNVDIYDLVDTEFKRKTYFSHPTNVNTPRGVIPWGACCFNGQEKEKLRNFLKDWNMYIFWNSLPIVETKTAREFIEKYNIVHIPSIDNNNICAAEHLPYQYFLILYHGWQIIDMSNFYASTYAFGILECGGTNQEMLDIMNPHFTYWLAYKLEPEKFSKYNIFLTIHHDRQDGWYGPPGVPVKFYTSPKEISI